MISEKVIPVSRFSTSSRSRVFNGRMIDIAFSVSSGLSLKFHNPVQQLSVSLTMPLDELSFHASLSVPESESFLNWLKSSHTVESIRACIVSASKVTPRFSRKSFAY